MPRAAMRRGAFHCFNECEILISRGGIGAFHGDIDRRPAEDKGSGISD